MGMISKQQEESFVDPGAIARKILLGIKLHQAFLAPLQSTGDQCWQILLHIYCAATTTDRTVEVLSAKLEMPIQAADRYFDLLKKYDYIQQHKATHGDFLELTPDAVAGLETVLNEIR